MDQKWWFQGRATTGIQLGPVALATICLGRITTVSLAFTTCIGRHQVLECAPQMAGISTACKLQPAMYIKCEYAFHLYIYHSSSITYFILICLVLESRASRSQIEHQHIDYLK